MQRFLSYENTILAVVMMVSFINPFTSSALTTALPGIGTAYGATDAQLSWVIELFLISSTVTIMPISKIADRIGKRHIFLFGVSLFCVSSLTVYFVNSLYGLFLLRILQGLGSASIFATSMAIVSLVTPPQRRGRAMGFTIAAVYCGLSFGPVLGGFFSYYLGWKTIFYFIAFICALAWLIAARSMTKEEWIVNAKGSLDLPGSLLYALAMIAIMVGLSEVMTLAYAKYLLAGGHAQLLRDLRHQFPLVHLLAAHYRPQCPRYGAGLTDSARTDGSLIPCHWGPVGPYQSSRPGFFRHDFDYLWPLSLSGGCLLPFFLAHRLGTGHHRHRLCPVHGTE